MLAISQGQLGLVHVTVTPSEKRKKEKETTYSNFYQPVIFSTSDSGSELEPVFFFGSAAGPAGSEGGSGRFRGRPRAVPARASYSGSTVLPPYGRCGSKSSELQTAINNL